MDPQIWAALIAGLVGLISLGGTVVVAIVGFRTTKSVTESTVRAGHEDTASTLVEQRVQLDKTLMEQHVRTLNERFATAADQLGSDKPPAVRLAGVYAMAGLADDWEGNRQTCIDVLCAYLRMPYAQDPGELVSRLGFLADREVRHTVIRVVTAHLRDGAAVSWRGRNFDFTGVVFDGGDFSSAQFSGGLVSFNNAEFSGGEVDFTGAGFSEATDFSGAKFSGGEVDFSDARFFAGFPDDEIDFSSARFSGGHVDFSGAKFLNGVVSFNDAKFSGADVSFHGAEISAVMFFHSAEFSGGHIHLGSDFCDGSVSFLYAEFSGGMVLFSGAKFSGAEVNFSRAKFSGGTVAFNDVIDWSHPPKFNWKGPVPDGVLLPKNKKTSRN